MRRILKRYCFGSHHNGFPSPAVGPAGSCSRQAAGGFTLVEILIAISIFAVVVTTIFGSFNFVFGNVEAIENGMTDYEMASDGLNRMMADLRSIHVSQLPAYDIPENSEEQDPYRVVGDIDTAGGGAVSRLRFTSLSHLPLGKQWRQGIAEITYYVQQQPDATWTLKRSDRLDFSESLEQERNDPILCENVLGLKFTYLDAYGDERERWDSDSQEVEYATPRAIRILLAVGSGKQSHEFEVLIALPIYRDNPEETLLQTIPSGSGSTTTYKTVPQ
jgi:general secretion pathway protein J